MKLKPANLVVKASDESISAWIKRPYISQSLREELSKANVLIVPNEGYHKRANLLCFPAGTEELLLFLREQREEGLVVDICIEEQDYKELPLHADWLIIADIMVRHIAAPLVVILIVEYIKRQSGKRMPKTEVRAKLTVQDEGTGRSVDFSYEGPATEFRDVMMNALEQKPAKSLQPPQNNP